ncbi:MAG TPA: LPS assembly lipoprotein LptE, partial [Rhodocyclaceae bacterium]
TVGFRLHDGKGGDLIPSSQIVLRRDITYSDDLLLAKGAEENLLWRDMLQDAVRQILRRMASAQKPLPPVGK